MHPLLMLLLLPVPIACASWTVAKEEVFREWREFCKDHAADRRHGLLVRKLCYVWTCEYCFSHYVAMFFLLLTGWRLVEGNALARFLVSWFAVVAIANVYMTVYSLLRTVLRLVGTYAPAK